MKKRSPVAVFFLSIITLGIYDLYWLVKTKKVLNQQTRTRTPTIWLLFSPLVFVIALTVVLIITSFHSSSSTTTLSATTDTNAKTEAIVLILELLAWLAVVPVSFYWFFKFSKSINEYTNGEMSTGLAFIMLWLLHFIGVAIVQDKFNDMLEAGQNNPTNPMPAAPNDHDQAYGSSVFPSSPATPAAPQSPNETPPPADRNQFPR